MSPPDSARVLADPILTSERSWASANDRPASTCATTSGGQLNADIRTWIQNWNDNPRPYIWTKTADQILESVANYCKRINDSGSLGNRSVEQVWLVPADPCEQRLEAEPACEVGADLAGRVLGHRRLDQNRRSRGFGHQLRVTRPLHRDEPPRRFLDGLADREQAVVAQDDGFAVAECMRDALAFLGVEDDARVGVEQRVVVVEGAGVLGDRVEQSGQRRPRLAVDRMGVRGADHVGPRRMHLRMDCERGLIHWHVACD